MFIFSTTLLYYLIQRRIDQDIFVRYRGLHAKYPLFLSDYNRIWTFDRLSKIFKISNFIKIHIQWEVCCSMWTDRHGQIDGTELIVTIHNFATHA